MITRSMAKRAAQSRGDNNTTENEPIASRTRNHEGGRIGVNNLGPQPIPAGPSQTSASPQQRRRRIAEPTNVNDLTISNDGNESQNAENLSDTISEHDSMENQANDDNSGLISENGSDDDSDGMSVMSFFEAFPLPLFRIFVAAFNNEDDDISFVSTSDGDTSSESVVKLSDISAASEGENIKHYENTEGRDPVSCIICAEDNVANPVKSTCCGQVIGCKDCVKRWYRTTNISALDVASPLSRGQSHENHKSCPYCRRPWTNEMLIEPY